MSDDYDNPPTMSMYADSNECYKAREAWFIDKIDKLEAELAEANERINTADRMIKTGISDMPTATKWPKLRCRR